MATVRFVELEGVRHEIGNDSIHYETRCDGCGEFMGDKEKASFSGNLFVPGKPVSVVNAEGHPHHLGDEVSRQVSAALGVPF